VIIAPATANIIGKLANGIADDAMSTFLLACPKKLFIAPAMNSNMYTHKAVQTNLSLLKQRGVEIIEPDAGFLACGTYGKGRMEEPENIFKTVHAFFASNSRFQGKKVLVTAGPTHEPIDPVRFIGNRSSGLMGFALAESFVRQGADVTLITGPASVVTHSIEKQIHVKTAAEMYEAVMSHFKNQDIIVMAAAVADYTPKEIFPEKMKKKEQNFTLELKKTTDILAELGKNKTENQYLTGFALETENEFENAKNKLQNKNLNLIVLNSMKNTGAGFETSTNQVTLISQKGKVMEFPLKEKREVADDITNFIYTELH
jgi:phosphopantothenoylcysteine decarboxylase/phosphopantothenate--cysteine ligase